MAMKQKKRYQIMKKLRLEKIIFGKNFIKHS